MAEVMIDDYGETAVQNKTYHRHTRNAK